MMIIVGGTYNYFENKQLFGLIKKRPLFRYYKVTFIFKTSLPMITTLQKKMQLFQK